MKLFFLLFGAAALLAKADEEAPATEEATEAPAETPGEPFVTPKPSGEALFLETFDDTWEDRWIKSTDSVYEGSWKLETYANDLLVGDKALMVGDPAKRHAISSKFPAIIDPTDKTLVIQYELQLKNGLECGGAYMKLVRANEGYEASLFQESTPYTIMYGPDKCGMTNKVHLIFQHKNPVSGKWEEKHITAPHTPTIDKMSHLYKVVIKPDNSIEFFLDNKSVKKGNLLEDFEPAVNPPKEIDDPDDKKPEDWVDEAKIDDPLATKPDDWDEDAPPTIEDASASKPSDWLDDEPDTVPDDSAKKPDDWDEDEDGDWEAPMIPNPKCKTGKCGEWKVPMISNPDYKGKWYAPKMDNPEYKGVWSPAQIPNPNFFEDDKPHNMAPMEAIAFELWTMQNGILFDNIVIANDEAVAEEVAAQSWVKRHAAEMAVKAKEEEEQKKKELESMNKEGFLNKLTYYFKVFLAAVEANPLIAAGTITAGVLPLVLYAFMGGKSQLVEAPAPAAEKPAEAEKPAASKPEAEDEVAEKKEKKSPSAKKRAKARAD